VQLVAPGSTQDLQAQIASLKEENRELSRANDTLKAASTFLGQSSTANSTHSRAPDLVKRRFVADPPNQLWVSDFTSGSTWEGFVYVAFIVDVYSRMVVGWRVSMTMTAKLVTDALEHAVWTRKRPVVGAIDRHPQPHPRCDAKHRSIQSPELGSLVIGRARRDYVRQWFRSEPIPSMWLSIMSPALRYNPFGAPTPSGVPVKIRSPVCNVKMLDR
jgi:Integrase core domain